MSGCARVARPYRAAYPDPIAMEQGDALLLGRRDHEYPGWIWATAPNGRSGWVPESFLEVSGERGLALRAYTARELDADVGLELTLREEVAGWVWADTAEGRSGWIPTSHLE